MQKSINSFDKIKINYDICNIKNKKDFLVFIHGVGGDLTAWKKIRDRFHKLGISTLAIDLRGHGKSEKPKLLEDYKIKKFAQDIKEILKKEKITHPILIGHSFGGMVTLTFHRLYPKLPKEYVLIGGTYKAPIKLTTTMKKFSSLILFLNKRFITIFPKRKKRYGKRGKFLGEVVTNNTIRLFFDIMNTSFKSWLFTLENINKFDEENILKTITKPVLILSGGKDDIISVKNSEKLHKMIKSSILKIFPEGNHILILTNPKEVSEEIYTFINKF